MTYDLVIKNGRIISGGADFIGDLAVTGQKIAMLGQNLSGAKEIDAAGKLVIPGAIDGHVHMRTERPSFCYDETFATGSVAAAFGGTTTMLDQVQAEFGRTLNEELDTRLGLAEGETAIDYAFHMNIREPIPERLAEIPSIIKRGITSFKWFMAVPGWHVPDDFLMRGMADVAEYGALSIVHAENQGVLSEMLRRAKAEGRTSMKEFNTKYPSAAEGAAATLALAMAEIAGGRVLIFHVSCKEVVEALRAAKARNVEAYGELCLAYVTHTDEVYHGDPVAAMPFLVTPPIRDETHRQALWQGLRQGNLDIVSTDHTVMRMVPAEQALELAAYFGLHPEIPPADESTPRDAEGNRLMPLLPPGGVEVRLPLIYSLGVRGGHISLHRWVEVCCSRPAKLFDLKTKGQLLPGYDADIVIFDPDKEHTFSVENLHSNTDYSVWEGWTTHGAVEKTISRGQVIVDGNEFVGQQDHGQFIKRSL